MNMTYAIYIKSHTEVSDFEAEVEAQSHDEAVNKFYTMLQGQYDKEYISENMLDM